MSNIRDINYQILLNTPSNKIMNLCQVNKSFSNLCQDEFFWKDKVFHDIGVVNDKPNDVNWKDFYRYIMQNGGKTPIFLDNKWKYLPIYINGVWRENIWVNSNETISNLLTSIINRLRTFGNIDDYRISISSNEGIQIVNAIVKYVPTNQNLKRVTVKQALYPDGPNIWDNGDIIEVLTR